MTPVRIRYETIEFGDVDIHVRTLRDTQEFSDDDGEAADLGISSATWSLFGVVWPSSRALADLMFDYDVAGKRVLELGCGIALASLVLNHRNCDITATDIHPEAGAFLEANVILNDGAPIPFVRTGWADDDDELGRFDLIIGSDVLYEKFLSQPLADFIERHARPTCEVVLFDPRRGGVGRFSKHLEAIGFVPTRNDAEVGDAPRPYAGEVLTFKRS